MAKSSKPPKTKSSDSNLLEFYGTECVHCNEMKPVIDRLEKEEKIKIQRIEVWHNSANAKMLDEYDQGQCGGVPFFYNKKTNKAICGSASYEALKKWALGK